MDSYNTIMAKIADACDELKSAGYTHTRDLIKYICRLKKQLSQCDVERSEAHADRTPVRKPQKRTKIPCK